MRSFPSLVLAVAVVCGSFAVVGCASSRPGAEEPVRPADVTGTWEYRTTGSPALSSGTLRIRHKDGDLRAVLEDARRGQLRTRQVTVRDTWMELRLDQVLVSGRLRDNRYRASVEIITWDVATSSRLARRSTYNRRGSMEAYQVRSSSRLGDAADTFGCPPLLRESSFACSPLRP